MLNNYFTIKETAKYLKENISGYSVNDIYTQEKDKMLIEVNDIDRDKSMILEYSVEKDLNYIIIKNNYSKARKNFAALFEDVYGKKITDVSLLNDDRIISFRLTDNKELIFAFFSNKANCYLTESGIVVNAFKDKKDFLQKPIYEILPAPADSSPVNPELNITADKFLRMNFRKYGDLYRKEVLFKTGIIEKEFTDEEKIRKIRESFREIDAKLEKPGYFIYSNESSAQMSLINVFHLKEQALKSFDNINELIREFIKFKLHRERADILKNKAVSEIKQKISNIDKKIKGIQTQLLHCEDSESLRKTGDIILQNLYLIKKGDKNFRYISEDGNEMIIKLKEEMTPSENARIFFDKYKKQKGSVDILKSKADNFKKEKSKLESELERISNMTEYKLLIKEEKKSDENRNDETSRFRKFRLNEKYEVWVGRDSASNDLLTTKYSAQNDLWFHVRGASGSHTVLKLSSKKEDTAKDIIHKAASIAAYYSKARNASNVPVAYCEKKYVKKKKGFKQGSVVMEREKVIFVKPGLPEQSETGK